jgi:hypothetical protein
MTKYRDFGSGKNTGEKEPVTFKLHEEEFSCREQLQGKTLLDLVARSSGDDPVESAKTIVLLSTFTSGRIPPCANESFMSCLKK